MHFERKVDAAPPTKFQKRQLQQTQTKQAPQQKPNPKVKPPKLSTCTHIHNQPKQHRSDKQPPQPTTQQTQKNNPTPKQNPKQPPKSGTPATIHFHTDKKRHNTREVAVAADATESKTSVATTKHVQETRQTKRNRPIVYLNVELKN